MTEYFILFLIFIICYLIGSIPFGLILTKLFDNNDLRNIGSGNIGATNVLRTGNKTLALLTLILDLSKSFIPLFIFFKLYPHPIINDFFNLIIVDQIFLILVSRLLHCWITSLLCQSWITGSAVPPFQLFISPLDSPRFLVD